MRREGPQFGEFGKNFSSCKSLPCIGLENSLKVFSFYLKKTALKTCVKGRGILFFEVPGKEVNKETVKPWLAETGLI